MEKWSNDFQMLREVESVHFPLLKTPTVYGLYYFNAERFIWKTMPGNAWDFWTSLFEIRDMLLRDKRGKMTFKKSLKCHFVDGE